MIIGTTIADWYPGDDCKWAQLPDLSPFGMDVDMTCTPLADDFLCTESSPILDIHFWGSFAEDILPTGGPGSLVFQISIHADIPAAGVEVPWSRPGEVLWTRVFTPDQYTWCLYHEGLEDWYNPATGIWCDDNHLLTYQYNFYIDESEAFVQEEGTIYWLSIKEIYFFPKQDDYKFGWKTCEFDQRWNDDAVWQCDPPGFWYELIYPVGHPYAGQSFDFAFVITGKEEEPPGKIECEKKVWDKDKGTWEDIITVEVGDTVRFKITFTYYGTTDILKNIIVTDTLPNCLDYANDAIPFEPSINGKVLTWNFGSMSDGDTIIIEFNASATCEGTHVNTVVIGGSIGCQIPIECEADATVIVGEQPAADIELRKYVKHLGQWAGYAQVYVGDTVEFKILATNIGNIVLTQVDIEDTLPSYLTYNYDANYSPVTATDHFIKWSGTLPIGETVEITFTADADTAGSQECNYAIVTTQEGPFDEDIACVEVIEPPSPDIELRKYVKHISQWAGYAEVNVGDTVEFKIVVTNTGTLDLHSVVVEDDLPTYLTYNYDANHTPTTATDQHIEWNLGTMTPQQTIEITFTADADTAGTQECNYAIVTTQEGPFDEDIACVDVEQLGDRICEKKVWDSDTQQWVEEIHADIGDTVRFKITITYNGPYTLYNIKVKDILPSCLEYANNAIPEEPEISGNILYWNLSITLQNGESISIEFDALVISEGININLVNITADECSGETLYCEDTATVIVDEQPGDMICEKKVWDSDTQQWVEEIHADIGDTVRFNITITYFGDSILSDIKVRDTLPSCLEYADNAIPEEPEISGNILYWNLSDWLNSGQSISIEFDARVISGGVNVNIANITAFDCGPQLVYCEDDATVIVEGAPLIADADGPYEEFIGKPVQFYGSATGGTGPYSWYWDFGDGKNSTLQNPTHVYSEGGVYIVNLTVTDYYGINDSDSTMATILSNAPPDTPSKPAGTTDGKIGKEYAYTSSTTDPDGDQIWYWFDWDDGTNSGWIGPYASGATGSAKHTWDEEGDYDIKVKAKDVNELESGWSSILSVKITKIEINLSIEILSFGFGRVRATITNMGEEDVDDVTWDMSAEWGSILKKNVSDSGTIGTMNIGDKVGISTGKILGDGSIRRGFGKITVTVTVNVPDEDPITEQATGFVIGKLVIIL